MKRIQMNEWTDNETRERVETRQQKSIFMGTENM